MHYPLPPAPAHLRPGDTVRMSATVSGPMGRLYTRTPCCYRRVIVTHEDVDYCLHQSATRGAHLAYVTRNCAGCGWPYRIRFTDPAGMHSVEFEVRQP